MVSPMPIAKLLDAGATIRSFNQFTEVAYSESEFHQLNQLAVVLGHLRK